MAKSIALPEKFTPDAIAEIIDSVPLPLTDIELDGSVVRQVSTPGLQMMISIARTVREAGHAFSIANMSDAMSDDLKTFGLSPEAALEDVLT